MLSQIIGATEPFAALWNGTLERTFTRVGSRVPFQMLGPFEPFSTIRERTFEFPFLIWDVRSRFLSSGLSLLYGMFIRCLMRRRVTIRKLMLLMVVVKGVLMLLIRVEMAVHVMNVLVVVVLRQHWVLN